MDAYTLAHEQFLGATELSPRALDHALSSLLGPGIDGGDLYFQHSISHSLSLEDGIVKEGSFAIEQGVGVRALAGEKMALAYADELSPAALIESARAVRALARQGQSGAHQALVRRAPAALYGADDPFLSFPTAERIDFLKSLDSYVRALDPRVQQVMLSINGVYERVLIAATDGTLAADVRPLVRLNVSVILEHQGRREQGYAGTGGRFALGRLREGDGALLTAREAVRQAAVNMEAIAAPAGTMTVVLGSGWPGVLLHEAVGHTLEGDFNRKGTSAFSGRMGEMVASPLCTVVDDGTLAERRGSLTIDDEGTASQCTTLIENGRLVGYLQDKLNARLMGVAPTGNGRRESFAHLTLPRMTNTYMRPGPHSREEIIASVDRGLYAVNFGGGQVDITSGKFVFSASEAYLIENGKVTQPVKGATLIGSGPEVLKRVSMLGDDLALDRGVGTCGKEGQSVPVGVGQPSMRIDGLTVGGTEAAA